MKFSFPNNLIRWRTRRLLNEPVVRRCTGQLTLQGFSVDLNQCTPAKVVWTHPTMGHSITYE